GTGGRYEERTGTNVAIGLSLPRLSAVRVAEFIARLGLGKRQVLSVSVFRSGLILLAFGSLLGAADQATRVFQAGERAHRAGSSFSSMTATRVRSRPLPFA